MSPKCSNFHEAFTELSQTFPDRYQFGRTPHAPTDAAFLAHAGSCASRPFVAAALEEDLADSLPDVKRAKLVALSAPPLVAFARSWSNPSNLCLF